MGRSRSLTIPVTEQIKDAGVITGVSAGPGWCVHVSEFRREG